MAEIKFPEGILAKKPHENAPDFVKAKLSIKKDDLITWLKMQDSEWINLDLKESQKGGYYLSVDDWKPNNQTIVNNEPPLITEENDLPFSRPNADRRRSHPPTCPGHSETHAL